MRQGILHIEPKRKCSDRVWATKMPYAQVLLRDRARSRKYCMYFFFDNKGPVMQLPVPKCRIATVTFYKNVALKKLKAYFKGRHPKTGLGYLRLLHDNAPAHEALPVESRFFSSP